MAGINRPRSSDLEEAAKQLIESKHPVIITERAGKEPEAVNALVELAELLSIPVFECTFPFYANFPRNHSLYMGNNAIEALHEADMVFIVGATTPWYPPSRFPQKDMKIIILDETIRHSSLIRQYLAEPNHYIKAGYGGLGVGLGEAAGVKLALGDRPVIYIVGDGSFHYNPVLAGLGFCQEYQFPIFIIVLNNDGYMAMKFEYDIRYPKGWAASHDAYLGVGINPAPDYIKMAAGFDAYGERLEEPGDIEGALKRACEQIKKGRTALLDVRIDSP